MNTNRLINAKSTERLLKSVFPEKFKFVSDKESNGYRLINILYGNEVDEALDRLEDVYNDSFLSTLDIAHNFTIYDATISGIPHTGYLTSSGVPLIRIVSEDEFYNAPPTRLVPRSSGDYLDLYSGIPSGMGMVGLEYMRTDNRGSGYFLVLSDVLQSDAYISGWEGTAWKGDIDSYGNIDNWSGYWPGIVTHNYDNKGVDEVLVPESSGTLKKRYPIKRRVVDESGVFHYIDHFEPNPSWTFDENGTAIAVDDYQMPFYFDDAGDKIYYRTALNNPYGSGNYTTVYLDLQYTPISGTMTLLDMDILNSSGYATPIPMSGKTLYTFTSPYMFVGEDSGVFDPVYLGYGTGVPYGEGFGRWEGSGTTALKVTSWEYLHEGGSIDPGTFQYVDGSGPITNKIKIVNPHSRYIVEYKYPIYKKALYVSSPEATPILSMDTSFPLYSIRNINDNKEEIEYEFTRNPKYQDISEDSKSKIVTFNGLDVRPSSKVSQVDITIPLVASGMITSFITHDIGSGYIGYSKNHVPIISSIKNYKLDCLFDSLSGDIEIDRSTQLNNLTYSGSVLNYKYNMNYNSSLGKSLVYSSGDQYFETSGNAFFTDNTFYAFGFTAYKQNNITLIDMRSDSLSGYLLAEITSKGIIKVHSNGYIYSSRDKIDFNSNNKELIIRYYPDDVSSAVPVFELFLKENDPWYNILSINKSEETAYDTSGLYYTRVYKDCTIDIDYCKIYTEAY